MRSLVLLLALLPSLGGSEPGSRANRGLAAALAEVNSAYAGSHLYRATRGSVKRVVPVAPDTADLLVVFGVKETVCAKASGSDPQTCAFRPGLRVPSFTCSGLVTVSPTSAQVASLRCGEDSGSSSSSSESSEEMPSRGRHRLHVPFANGGGVPTRDGADTVMSSTDQRDTALIGPGPAPSPPPPPPPPPQLVEVPRSREEEAQPAGRGDTFSNFLV